MNRIIRRTEIEITPDMRRQFSDEFEQRIYDGFVDHPFETAITGHVIPSGRIARRDFSPFSSVVSDLFFKVMEQGPLSDDLDRVFHPNPRFKRPAYYAAHDLFLGEVQRGTTALIEKWRDGGNIPYSGYIFSRHSITKTDTYSQIVALKYDGLIFYVWGALPGHRFPADAIPYAVMDHDWKELVKAVKDARLFEKGSFLTKGKSFAKYEKIVREKLPPKTTAYRILEMYGTIGLLRLHFGKRWNALISTPNMRLADGIPHCYVKDSRGNQFLLCNIDDAVHHKMKNSDECTIHDLTTPMPLEGLSS